MVNVEVVKFKYTAIVADDYIYRGAVDNHNALRYDVGTKSQIGLESAWGTTWWSTQLFAFFIACTEVNAYLAMKYLLKKYENFMNLRKNG